MIIRYKSSNDKSAGLPSSRKRTNYYSLLCSHNEQPEKCLTRVEADAGTCYRSRAQDLQFRFTKSIDIKASLSILQCAKLVPCLRETISKQGK